MNIEILELRGYIEIVHLGKWGPGRRVTDHYFFCFSLCTILTDQGKHWLISWKYEETKWYILILLL